MNQVPYTRLLLLPTLVLGLIAVSAADGSARQSAPQIRTIANPANVPFGVGEKAEYQVRLGAVTVGSGSMEVVGLERVNGAQTYRTRMMVQGGIPFARVDDRFESWIDVNGLFSRRFRQDQKEIRFERRRTFEFFPESRVWRTDTGETGTLASDRPLDDVSFLYYARTLPLVVGETYTIPRYFRGESNPVILQVLRKETVRVPAGEFETIVVRPIIKTRGLFAEGGEAEVYFTDDNRRLMVQMRSRVSRIGSLTLHMRSYEPGQRLSNAPFRPSPSS